MARRLGGIYEIAMELGISLDNRSTISNWDTRRAQTGFPEPVTRLKAGPVFDLDEVREWFDARYPDGLPEREGGRPKAGSV